MYKCDFCGRISKKKNRIYGYTTCSKHMHQLLNHGHVLDHNPRSEKDLNEFRYLTGGIAEFDVYDIHSEVSGHFIVDASDVPLIRWHKWRMDTNRRIITGNCTSKNPRRELSRFILGVENENFVVDHIDGNPFNNTRQNLRICTQQENTCNKVMMSTNTSGMIGVSWDKARKKWAPEIRSEYMRCHLGRFNSYGEAACARYFAEQIVFGAFQNQDQMVLKKEAMKSVSAIRQREIGEFVLKKLQDKGMAKNGYQLCGSSESAA